MSTLDLISAALPRIRQLVVTAPTTNIQSFCAQIGRTMDQLQHLSLSSEDDDYDDVLPHLIKLPLVTIDDFAPRLRRLHLRRLPFVWTDLIFHAKLVSLDVNGTYRRNPERGTIQQFFAAMERLAPELEDLTLEDAIPPSSGLTDGSPSCAPHMCNLSFPALRSLTLKDKFNGIAGFLSGISFRPSTTISLTGNGETGFEGIARKLSDVLNHEPPLLLSAAITCFNNMEIVMGHTPASPYEAPVPLYLTLDADMQGNERIYLMLQESSMLFSHVQYLRMTPGPYDWTPLISRLPKLLTLSLVGNPGAIFQALTLVGPEDSVPLPALRVLELEDVRFDTEGGKQLIENLIDWAMLRCNHGVPLETLSLHYCLHTREDDVGLLKEIVADVDWDHWGAWLDREFSPVEGEEYEESDYYPRCFD